jgi:hypothetical protein
MSSLWGEGEFFSRPWAEIDSPSTQVVGFASKILHTILVAYLPDVWKITALVNGIMVYLSIRTDLSWREDV